jgi:predicted NAD/FAD-binding protein
MAAQQQRDTICGQNNTHFCGAYWYNGFHEDGVRSALDVAKRFGCEL